MREVRGRVIAVPSRQPVPNVLVVVYDIDTKEALARREDANMGGLPAPLGEPLLDSLGELGERIGSVLTNPSGEFLVEYDVEELGWGKPSEQRADLFVLVMSPESSEASAKDLVLHHSRELRRNAGRVEQYLIQISEDVLKEKGVPLGTITESNISKIEAFQKRQIEERELAEGMQRKRVEAVNVALGELKVTKERLLRSMAPAAPILDDSRSIRLAENATVKSVMPQHIVRQLESFHLAASANRRPGIEVSFVLDQVDRESLNIAPGDSGRLTLTRAQFDRLAAKMSSSTDNLILTSDNPILRECLERPGDVQETIDLVRGRPPSGPTPPEGPTSPGEPSSPPDPLVPPPLDGDRIDSMLAAVLAGASPVPSDSEHSFETKADNANVNASVDRVSLARGPADQPAYYDFSVLNVAFGHIWKQVLDDSAATAAAVLTGEIRKLGIALDATDIFSVSTAGYEILRSQEPPASVIAELDVTPEEWAALSSGLRSKLEHIAHDIEQANASRMYFPYGRVSRPAYGITKTEAPGYLEVSVAVAERYKSELRAQGEAILDHVRSTNVRSLHTLLRDLDVAMKSRHAFQVFGADDSGRAVNFGLLNVYRQRWEPIAYQVGDLVRSIPLAPKEERRYSVKQVVKTKRSEKEQRKSSSSATSEIQSTGRSEEDIVFKAQNKVNFNLSGAFERGGWKVASSLGVDAQKESQQNRKSFREAIIKAHQEYKEERSIDISVEHESEGETQESGVIQNPNDEIAATYLFYELQKRFKVSEQLFRTMPVVMVAQPVPRPEEITDAFIVAHDWVLNRVLLDDSFRPALVELGRRNVGDDFAIRELRKNLRQQRQTVDVLRRELAADRVTAQNRYRALEQAIETRIDAEHENRSDGSWENFKEWFGGEDVDPEAQKAREMAARDAHQFALEKVEKSAAALQGELAQLNQATSEYQKAYREHLDKLAATVRLRAHIKDNIIYYMQAIWSAEGADQRYMRLLGTEVPTFRLASIEATLERAPADDIFAPFRGEDETLHRAWLKPTLEPDGSRPIEEVADLGTLLGYFGNYMVFPLKKHNPLTEIMAMPYVDASFGAMDPDQLANISLEDFVRYVRKLRKDLDADGFAALRPTLQAWLELLLADPLRNGDEVVVPTKSLYIEVLASAHTLMERYKLEHRQLDVEKVRTEVRDKAVDVLRKAKRIVLGQLDDPSVEKKISIQPGVSNAVVVDPTPP